MYVCEKLASVYTEYKFGNTNSPRLQPLPVELLAWIRRIEPPGQRPKSVLLLGIRRYWNAMFFCLGYDH